MYQLHSLEVFQRYFKKNKCGINKSGTKECKIYENLHLII